MAEPYRVGRPQASGQRSVEEKIEPLRPRAVFVAHGMGQQVPFQTLDDVARGLCKTIESSGAKVESRTAKTVRVGCETLQRLELDIRSADGPLPPIHVYEAYWAPLTEGAVGLWQVVRFLLSGGFNGLRSDAKLNRFMFGKPRRFAISRWALAALAVVIATVVAVLIIGVTIATVAAARLTLDPNGWANADVVRELTTLFERLLGVVAAGAAVMFVLIAISRWLMPKDAKGWRLYAAWIVSALNVIPLMAIIVVLVITAYVAIPVIFMFNVGAPVDARECAWCTGWGVGVFQAIGAQITLVGPWARDFVKDLLLCPLPERAAWLFLVGLGVLIVLYALLAAIPRKGQDRGTGGRVTGVALALLALAGILAICGQNDALAVLTWLLLFGAVLFVRSFLIQFVGDVAIYVSPHVIDRFFDLRVRIRKVVLRSARAVYALRGEDGQFLYREVAIVGHSLGSVIVYDALNRLINDDDLSAGAAPECCDEAPVENLDVSNRTRLLLTFGSPLDKTAFIFAQHDPHGGSERDALAASVQPLITRERKFKWRNLWTPFDILGGRLQFYDTPKGDDHANGNRVINRIDPRAITPLAGHTEFWNNSLMYDLIYGEFSD